MITQQMYDELLDLYNRVVFDFDLTVDENDALREHIRSLTAQLAFLERKLARTTADLFELETLCMCAE